MLGGIIGDVAGSIYEVYEVEYLKKKQIRPFDERIEIFDSRTLLITKDCSYTDDSVLICAIADAILNNGDYEEYLRLYGERELKLGLDKYGRDRFSKGFIEWLLKKREGNSYGNGSAMRIGPVGFLFNNISEIYEQSRLATIPSHNNEEAIAGATAVALSTYFIRDKYTKREIKSEIENRFNYNLNFNLEDLQRNYSYKTKCVNTVPYAIYCFLISNSFEDAIRKAISIGGDSDTIACIVGVLAEAYYGIPENLIKLVTPYIPLYMISVINNFYKKINKPIILRR